MIYSKYSVDELQGYYSDFHKDFYGYRPRGFGTVEQWNDRDWLIAQIEQIHDAMDKMKESFAGREELRTNGWVIEETDPELAKQAKWLADERKREYDTWVANIEKNYVEEMESVYSSN
jgi:hypothetical protein